MLQLVMVQLAAWFRLPSFKLPTFDQIFAEETAQDTFEYLLVLGVIVVGVITAVLTFPDLINTVVGSVTTSVTGLLS